MKENDTAPDVGNKDGLAGGAQQDTPGPWTMGRPRQGERDNNDPRDLHYPIFWPDCGCAAHVFREADARLVAAAPELLRVVRIVYANDFLAGCITVPGGLKSFKLFVEELLAKATEGEPANSQIQPREASGCDAGF